MVLFPWHSAVPECGLALGRATNGITIGDLHHAVSSQQHDIPEPPTKYVDLNDLSPLQASPHPKRPRRRGTQGCASSRATLRIFVK